MEFKDIRIEELDLIKLSWQKLNRLHLQDSIYFKEHYEAFTFEKRIQSFLGFNPMNIKIQIVEVEDNKVIGYCISTIKDEIGEIESLYIEETYRKNGLGNKLMENAVEWLKECRCTKINVSVSYGHEDVFAFYMKNGLYPRMTQLEYKG